MIVPKNPGATIRHISSGNMYVRDQKGFWHRGDFKWNDLQMEEHITGFASAHETLSEGVVVGIPEPKKLGAVVEFSPDKTRAVFDGSVWVARWYDGTSTNMPWDQIVQCGSVTILSEGV